MVRARNTFFKGHGLGNDYIALEPGILDFRLTRRAVQALCDRHRGVGSDGVLALVPSSRADYGLRIFNPDGSEAEKSGNGLRIFARYLHATRRTRRRTFTVDTPGGVVRIVVHPDARGEVTAATVEMGTASFHPRDLPCTLPVEELIQQPITVADERLTFTGVNLGNPHCVVVRATGPAWTHADLLRLGPVLEQHELFPKRVNVQLATRTGPRRLTILIWERGAGETQASGSSACAAAAAAVRLGLVRSPVSVSAPGGALVIVVAADFAITMTGPVDEVAQGTLSTAFVRQLQRLSGRSA